MSLIPLSRTASKPPPTTFPLCGKCQLHTKCKTPKMPPSGKNGRRIMLVGEAPGRNEDDEGRPFVGKSGQLIKRLLLKYGVNMREDCVILNALSCHPANDFIKDPMSVEYCRPLVTRAIEQYDPVVIIPMGKHAVRSVIGPLWKENTGGAMKWAGYQIPCRKPNVWICPTIHPSFVLRKQDKRGYYTDKGMTERYFESHLEAAVNLTERPWTKIPNYERMVEAIHDDAKAAAAVVDLIKTPPISFDYETNCLKPDGPDAKIVCVAMSNGKRTIAFMWRGEAKREFKKFLASNVPKMAHNKKFEDRWSSAVAKVDIPPASWFWCSMIQAHTLDQRREITGLKFQALTRFGQEDYNSHLHQYLASKEKGAGAENRIHEIDRDQLLLYAGLDALLEWMLAKEQTKELGIKWPT